MIEHHHIALFQNNVEHVISRKELAHSQSVTTTDAKCNNIQGCILIKSSMIHAQPDKLLGQNLLGV